MALINRIRMIWSGVTGLPGVSTFYSQTPTDTGFAESLQAAAIALAPLLPSAVTLQVESEGDTLEDSTGILSGSWSRASFPAVPGSVGPTGHAAGTGCRVRWGTAGVVDGRRVRGRTFLAPIASIAYEGDGTLVQAYRAFAQNFADEILQDGTFAIWSRPTGGAGGSSHLITSAVVPDQVSSLRSRRS